jgi:hypothetical protein
MFHLFANLIFVSYHFIILLKLLLYCDISSCFNALFHNTKMLIIYIIILVSIFSCLLVTQLILLLCVCVCTRAHVHMRRISCCVIQLKEKKLFQDSVKHNNTCYFYYYPDSMFQSVDRNQVIFKQLKIRCM